MKWKQFLLIVAVSAGSALGGAWLYGKFFSPDNYSVGTTEKGLPANYAGFFDSNKVNAADAIDLTKAANSTVPAVVHIKTKVAAKKMSNDLPRRQRSPFDEFFSDMFPDQYGPNMMPEQRASGSGVLISEDGYIITNNHVISNGSGGVADEINVTLSTRKSYKARLIGRDPSSDIAVLKIDGNKFPFLVYGNSNNVQLGQWVLAVGYPLSLEATVTAGIISATGRTININRRQSTDNTSPIESFIQTDAAVNQGNSGGALVNTNGELVGINSAILAPTGTYAGYSFAIPVNIARKIVEDIIRTGEVQRGYLGIEYPTEELSAEQLKELGVPSNVEGVYVSSVSPDGGASEAGIKKGDVITKINTAQVLSGLQMSAQIAAFRPGDKVPVTYVRGGKEYTTTVTLKKKPGSFEGLALQGLNRKLGAQLRNLTAAQAKEFGVSSGVLVTGISEQGPISRTRISEGYIITKVNGQPVKNIEEMNRVVGNASGSLKVEGVYPGFEGVYPYVIRLDD